MSDIHPSLKVKIDVIEVHIAFDLSSGLLCGFTC